MAINFVQKRLFVDRHYATEEPTQPAPAPSTLFKVDSIREEALSFNMTPHSHEKLQKSLGYLESRYRVTQTL